MGPSSLFVTAEAMFCFYSGGRSHSHGTLNFQNLQQGFLSNHGPAVQFPPRKPVPRSTYYPSQWFPYLRPGSRRGIVPNRVLSTYQGGYRHWWLWSTILKPVFIVHKQPVPFPTPNTQVPTSRHTMLPSRCAAPATIHDSFPGNYA